MANPVGFRFRPTDEEIILRYLRPKNEGTNTSHVDGVISTVNICSFDPCELPSQSRMESREDEVWLFFGVKEKKYKRGERQSRKTKSGFWKITGKSMEITTRNKENRQKVGEKRVLVFHSTTASKTKTKTKTNWVMHEYHDTSLSPNQMTYTVCKVMFKGEEREISSSSATEIEPSHSLIDQMNNSGALSTGSEVGQSQTLTGSEGSSFECRELGNPRQFSDSLGAQEEDFDWLSLLNDDDDVDEQGKILLMQQDRSDYRPKMSLTAVFSGDDTAPDSDSISAATTSSIQTSTTCDSFRIDQNTDLEDSPKKVCQESTKNKRAGFFYRVIQRFIKKIRLCSSSISGA